MNPKRRVGPLVAAAIVVLGLSGLLAYRFFFKPRLDEQYLQQTSDSGQPLQTIEIAGDNYLGYWFITSKDLQRLNAQQGLAVKFTNDGGDYAERMKRFANKEVPGMVLPVSSYLKHGAQYNYPGVIVVAVAESRGADGIIAFADKLPTGQISDLNNPDLRVVYTADSPSSFLGDLTKADFGLGEFMRNPASRIEVKSSQEVYQKAGRKEGDVFILWEPDLSRALQLPGMKYVWGSDKFSGYIVDVFVFHREFVESNHDLLTTFFRNYFRSINLYANNRAKLITEMAQTSEIKDRQVIESMLKKIHWYDLFENTGTLFGIQEQTGLPVNAALFDTINACADRLIRSGQLQDTQFQRDPRLITRRSLLEAVLKTTNLSAGETNKDETTFDKLSDEMWRNLDPVGPLRVDPINFQSQSNQLSEDGIKQVDQVAQLLKNNYPAYRVVVQGHTGVGSDESANEKLSLERSQRVMDRLISAHHINPNRLRTEGLGSRVDPKRLPDESERSFRERKARVEFWLFRSSGL